MACSELKLMLLLHRTLFFVVQLAPDFMLASRLAACLSSTVLSFNVQYCLSMIIFTGIHALFYSVLLILLLVWFFFFASPALDVMGKQHEIFQVMCHDVLARMVLAHV